MGANPQTQTFGTHSGQRENTGDVNALHARLFLPNVVDTAMELDEVNMYVRNISITGSESQQYPVIGRQGGVPYIQEGVQILDGAKIPINARTIKMRQIKGLDYVLQKRDQILSYWNKIPYIVKKIVESHVLTDNYQVYGELIAGAKNAALVSGGYSGMSKASNKYLTGKFFNAASTPTGAASSSKVMATNFWTLLEEISAQLLANNVEADPQTGVKYIIRLRYDIYREIFTVANATNDAFSPFHSDYNLSPEQLTSYRLSVNNFYMFNGIIIAPSNILTHLSGYDFNRKDLSLNTNAANETGAYTEAYFTDAEAKKGGYYKPHNGTATASKYCKKGMLYYTGRSPVAGEKVATSVSNNYSRVFGVGGAPGSVIRNTAIPLNLDMSGYNYKDRAGRIASEQLDGKGFLRPDMCIVLSSGTANLKPV